MTGTEVIDVAREALYVFLSVAGPILMIGLVIGVVIAFFQSITQIQEMTLTFVPKALAVFGSLLILLPYMGSQLSTLMDQLMERVISGGL